MITLNTKRLKIVALDSTNFKFYLSDMKSMEKNLGVNISGKELDEGLKEAFSPSYQKMMEDQENYVFYTNWQAILKSENKIIAGISIKGLPNDDGEVEIGYGTDPAYQNKGYMTEILKGIIEWTFSQKDIKSVIAETLKENISSQRVLEKAGMHKYKEVEEFYWYRIDKRI